MPSREHLRQRPVRTSVLLAQLVDTRPLIMRVTTADDCSTSIVSPVRVSVGAIGVVHEKLPAAARPRIDGDTLIASAERNQQTQRDPYVDVFVKSGATWVQQKKWIATPPANAFNFGDLVALSNDTALVKSEFELTIGAQVFSPVK